MGAEFDHQGHRGVTKPVEMEAIEVGFVEGGLPGPLMPVRFVEPSSARADEYQFVSIGPGKGTVGQMLCQYLNEERRDGDGPPR